MLDGLPVRLFTRLAGSDSHTGKVSGSVLVSRRVRIYPARGRGRLSVPACFGRHFVTGTAAVPAHCERDVSSISGLKPEMEPERMGYQVKGARQHHAARLLAHHVKKAAEIPIQLTLPSACMSRR
jgi:hypothetical protein